MVPVLREEDEMGMGQVAGFNLGLTGYFTFRHNGKINGFKLEYARGMSQWSLPHTVTSERNITTDIPLPFLFSPPSPVRWNPTPVPLPG